MSLGVTVQVDALDWRLESDCDETAARRLTLSLRTYRRRVAELMRTLDADSRFQAGVRAGELGLTG